MRNRNSFTMVEIMAGLIIGGILFLILIAVANPKEMTPEQQMENCMYEYEDFEYCKYKLGVRDHD